MESAGTIYILCAEWCRVCRELQFSSPTVLEYRIVWIDIDKDEHILEGLEIDNLPTLAVSKKGCWSFWGTAEPIWKNIFKLARRANVDIEGETLIRLSRMERILMQRQYAPA